MNTVSDRIRAVAGFGMVNDPGGVDLPGWEWLGDRPGWLKRPAGKVIRAGTPEVRPVHAPDCPGTLRAGRVMRPGPVAGVTLAPGNIPGS
jgi:hypothetical protein